MEEEEKPSALSKLPGRLQLDFFEMAEKAARQAAERMLREREKLRRLRDKLRFRDIPEVDFGELRVGAVDGSASPSFSERLGYRVGVYTACYMVFEGDEIISDEDDESMKAGYMMADQTGNILHTKKILSLLMTALERELALRCLKKYDLDLILVDGSFYGFRTRCSEVKNCDMRSMGVEGYKRGWDLIKQVLNDTRRLDESGKAVGVVKRLRTAAIDGWLLTQGWRIEETFNRNDRSILRSLLPPGKYFDYRELLGERWSYLHYNGLKTWYNEIIRLNQKKGYSDEGLRENALEFVHKKLRTQVRTDLCPPDLKDEALKKCGEEILQEITSVPRLHARLSSYSAPICLELGEGVNVELALAYAWKTANKATGIPFPVDLVDEAISVDRLLAREFADEVEARLLLDSKLEAEEVEARLEPLNPQKREE